MRLQNSDIPSSKKRPIKALSNPSKRALSNTSGAVLFGAQSKNVENLSFSQKIGSAIKKTFLVPFKFVKQIWERILKAFKKEGTDNKASKSETDTIPFEWQLNNVEKQFLEKANQFIENKKTYKFSEMPEDDKKRLLGFIQDALTHESPFLNAWGKEVASTLGLPDSLINKYLNNTGYALNQEQILEWQDFRKEMGEIFGRIPSHFDNKTFDDLPLNTKLEIKNKIDFYSKKENPNPKINRWIFEYVLKLGLVKTKPQTPTTRIGELKQELKSKCK